MPDLTITPANVINTGKAPTKTGIAGEALTAGQTVYVKSADGKIYKAQCDATPEEADCAGITLNGASLNQPVEYVDAGAIDLGATTTTAKTTTYMVSATAGGICPQADLIATQRIVQVGYATNTTGSFVVRRVNTGVTV